MGKIKLAKSQVSFDSERHLYTLGALELSGVTGVIRSVILHDASTPPESAFAHGRKVHDEIQSRFYGLCGDEPSEEYKALEAWREENGVTFSESEFIVSDGRHWASAIDLIGDDGTIYDVKTNRTGVETLYVRWQLSIYRYLLFVQCGFVAPRLVCLHLTAGGCEAIEMEPVPDEQVERFLRCAESGEPYEQGVAELARAVAELTAEANRAKDALEAAKALLMTALKEQNAKGYKDDSVTITYVPESVTVTLDAKRLQEDEPDLYQRFRKESVRKESLTVKIKK